MACQRGQDIAHRSCRRQPDRRARKPQTLGAHAHLPGRFLAADIDGIAAGLRNPGSRLKQKCRFADPRIAAHQDSRAGHQTAAQRAVKFRQPGRAAHQLLLGRIKRLKGERTAAAGKAVACGKHRFGRILAQRVPLAAIGALPLPAKADGTAGSADIAAFGFGHRHCLHGTYRERKSGNQAKR